MWFLHQTGATTYRQDASYCGDFILDSHKCSLLIVCNLSLVGSLNKIPLSVAGIVLFHVPTSLENSASIFFGKFSPFSLVAGVFFAKAKMRERSQS
ncbi:GDP-mannose transporter GONST1 [Vitis vinifera]|uniref:GDP-mannose transporter GONST1 n=1 Tax=Vitis vinifera TaxID=29760 RepID=A0A438HR58_VITVI|nr:GDP-mannose transporter GONST1 [Vitis vinifera]